MIKLRCKNCNFVFMKASKDIPTRCPYCAESDAVITEEEYFSINRELESSKQQKF